MNYTRRIIILFFLYGITLNICYSELCETEDKHIELNSSSSILNNFKGKIRLWRSVWFVDDNNKLIPYTFGISVMDIIVSNEGFDFFKFYWAHPLRKDLTPDIEYKSYTKDRYLSLIGTDNTGLRAVIYPPKSISVSETQVGLLFKNPAFTVLGLDESWWNNITYSNAEKVDISDFTIEPLKKDSLVLLSGSKVTRTRNMESSFIDVLGIAESGDDISSKTYWPNGLIGIDVKRSIINVDDNLWDENSNYSLRVLSRQHVLIGGEMFTAPRIIIGDIVCKRPNYREKSYHRRHIMLVDMDINDNQRLIGDLENLMPTPIKLIDIKNNTVKLLQGADNAIISSYIDEIAKGSQKEFIELITSDLSTKFPFYIPLSKFKADTQQDQGDIGDNQLIGQNFFLYDLANNKKQQDIILHEEIDIFKFLNILLAENDNSKDENNIIARKGYEPVQQEVRKNSVIILFTNFLILTVSSIIAMIYFAKRHCTPLALKKNN